MGHQFLIYIILRFWRGFFSLRSVKIVGLGVCVYALVLGCVWAQSGVRKMIENRSLPDRLSTQAIDKASHFSPVEVRIIDRRSVMSAELEAVLSRRSEFSTGYIGKISVRSEFSASDLQKVQKRSEPDVAFSKQVQIYSTPDAHLRQRDRIVDDIFFNAVKRQSEMNTQEKKQVAKASDHAAIYSELQRNSVSAASYSRLLQKRSVPESAWQRLLRLRSVD